MKKVWFQLHWLFGISAGLVLALMGLSGAMLSFQDEILRAVNPASLTVEKRAEGTLPMDELIHRVESAEPGKKVAFVWVTLDGDQASRLFYTPKPGQRRGESRYVDPYTAQFLPAPRGEGFFNFVMQLHRFLAAGELGKQVTAASTLILLYLCLSGLYLRWPRKALNWRAWLTFDWAKKGRAFNWDLHAVAGTWCLAFYLLAALSGLYWSYDWYRGGLFKLLDDTPAGQPKGLRGGKRGPAPKGPPPEVDASAVWATIEQTGGAAMTAYNLRLPPVKGQPATVFYLLDDAAHERAFNEMTIDPASGKLLADKRYTDSSFGKQLLTSVYALHVGSYFGLAGRILMMLASLSMPLFFITGWLLYLDRRRKQRAAQAARGELDTRTLVGDAWLVGYASQSGLAEQLAWQSAGQLQAAGLPVRVEPLAKLDRAQLEQTRNALFVVSTFGDGEAPDNARGFERHLLGQSLGLGDLRYAVLALGDRQYEHFCGFARRLQGWLQGQGARALFDGVEVDNGDAAALHDWQRRLAELSGAAPQAAFSAPAFEVWTLAGREHLNPGSQGEPTWLLRLAAPNDSRIDWSAGDLVEIAPRQPAFLVEAWLDRLGLDGGSTIQAEGIATSLKIALAGCLLPGNLEHLVGLHGQAVYDALIKLSVRQYSIASLRSDGALELIVRQEQHADGSLGICSGWLTAYLPEGGNLLLRLRRNRSFHLCEADRPLILIGNGTGLAGLRSLLRASIAEGRRRNWLLFGERNLAHDFYCREELESALARGELQRLDVAFSRDQAEKVYVQDRLRASGEVLAQWLDEGALIYVCGSLQGMAEGVDRALREMLGDAQVEELLETGRYRRDVY
ncbi:sulfite reductase flavoprotein subunit alpha [Pseudomonas sp. ATCC 13867]|uniref:sulfite reductase flavoprotein subunit alpha n=1 Tax=Pseudomonas sp. ATCC 13867 TaxID=1294143 RepID=UPI0005A053A0|nr:sulfite reductase flavoprotein subunit alpha [Pseudomonas sp. ATCC 13867]